MTISYTTHFAASVHPACVLADGERRSIYDFRASYTLADRGAGLRITAIARNEVSRLKATVERQRRN